MNPALYFHTLRYLRPLQIYGRIWHRLNPAKPDLGVAPELRLSSAQWIKPFERSTSMLNAESFRFLNIPGQIPCSLDWNDPAQEKLWLYNLHYFDDLNAVGAVDRVFWHRTLLARWVAENPPGMGNGWESYPTSLRIVNWIKWALAGNELDSAWIHSLAVQTRWLLRHIEWHLLGNHLFANAKALVFAGLFFQGDEANRWLTQGLKILAREIPEQILPDGGHFELSPMYHAIILEDLLDLINAANTWSRQVPEMVQWRIVAERMLRWLEGLIHPDGDIAFFNDAALGIAPDFSALARYAKRLDIEAVSIMPRKICTHFTDSGYIRLEQTNVIVLLDVTRIGPDYLPGHAHADTLSFELSLFGQRVIVNSGTSLYGLGAERLRQRGTSAHNTVVVDGNNSSEVWSGFRVARRARPFGLAIVENNHNLTVTCAHDGYRRLPGRPIHRRCWHLDEHTLQVSDVIEGDFHTAVAHYFVHPLVTVTGEGKEGQLQLFNGRVVKWFVVGGIARVVSVSWHPEFGLSIPSKLIEILFDGYEAQFILAWD